jgi:hypothetical protein
VKAETAQEILTFLKREHSYGEKVTGAKLVEEFGGLGYGWSPEIVRLILAVLFRAGAIEVTYQSRRYRNYQDPQARAPFVTTPAFRSAGFSPRDSIDLATLRKAVEELEAMLGREVDVEESAIAEEFQKLARLEREQALPALAQVRALNLPLVQPLTEWVENLESVLGSHSDDCVRMLAGEGRSLRALREKAHRIGTFLTGANIEMVQHARAVLRDQAPLLARSNGMPQPEASTIAAILADVDIVERGGELASAANAIDTAYRILFAERHQQRLEACRRAIQEVKENASYRALDPAATEAALAPLYRRAVETFELPPRTAAERLTGATLATLEDDLDLVPSLAAGALAKLAEAREQKQEPQESVEVVHLSDFLPKTQPLADFSDAELDAALEKLKQKLYALRELKRRVLWD